MKHAGTSSHRHFECGGVNSTSSTSKPTSSQRLLDDLVEEALCLTSDYSDISMPYWHSGTLAHLTVLRSQLTGWGYWKNRPPGGQMRSETVSLSMPWLRPILQFSFRFSKQHVN